MSNETHSERVRKAVIALLAKLDQVAKDTAGMFVMAHVHGQHYKGANWSMEYEELQQAIAMPAETHSEKGLRERLDEAKAWEEAIRTLPDYAYPTWKRNRLAALEQALAATPAVREPGPAITEAQAQDAYCDSFDTDAPAVAPAPDFKRLAKAINRFLVAGRAKGEAGT